MTNLFTQLSDKEILRVVGGDGSCGCSNGRIASMHISTDINACKTLCCTAGALYYTWNSGPTNLCNETILDINPISIAIGWLMHALNPLPAFQVHDDILGTKRQ